MSEEDKVRIEDAKTCEGCLGWHKHCHAECCNIVFIKDVDPKVLDIGGKFLNLGASASDDRYYYKLRDVNCVHGYLRFRKDRIKMIGKQMIYFYPCKMLGEDLLCKIHEKKPKLCRALTLETASIPNQPFKATDNCLYKYKQVEVNINDKET